MRSPWGRVGMGAAVGWGWGWRRGRFFVEGGSGEILGMREGVVLKELRR